MTGRDRRVLGQQQVALPSEIDHGCTERRAIQLAPLGDYLGCPAIDFPYTTVRVIRCRPGLGSDPRYDRSSVS
jgi:hypothetical protein